MEWFWPWKRGLGLHQLALALSGLGITVSIAHKHQNNFIKLQPLLGHSYVIIKGHMFSVSFSTFLIYILFLSFPPKLNSRRKSILEPWRKKQTLARKKLSLNFSSSAQFVAKADNRSRHKLTSWQEWFTY